MITFLALLLLLIPNGDFSHGFTFWNPEANWTVKNQTAQVLIDNNGTVTEGANLCSDPLPLTNFTVEAKVLSARGYVFFGARHYVKGIRTYDEMSISEEGAPLGQWQTYHVPVTPDGDAVAFCAYAGGYKGKLQVRIDNIKGEK